MDSLGSMPCSLCDDSNQRRLSGEVLLIGQDSIPSLLDAEACVDPQTFLICAIERLQVGCKDKESLLTNG